MKIVISHSLLAEAAIHEENPVVLAIRKSLPEDVKIEVVAANRKEITVGSVIYRTPKVLASFIADFEAGRRLKPLKVEIGKRQ